MGKIIKTRARSHRLWLDAQRVLAGGVNSPVRSFRAVGGEPVFIQKAKGARFSDADGNRYLDYVLSWGALILGHAPDAVVKAVREQMGRGSSYGIPTALETDLAREIQRAFPGMERVRFTSSGTEAAMSALRLARAFTGRERIVKFDGCYHGHADELLVRAGSGTATFGLPASKGVPRSHTQGVCVLPYNDPEAVRRAFRARGRSIAACIVEPVAGNMGVVEPSRAFLETLRRETKKAGSLLIFDEVITGFRVGYGGAQRRIGIQPDLTLLGKIVGGGLPCACFGGRWEILKMLAPLDGVYQAGTLSGNPLAMSAGLATLRALRKPGAYQTLEKRAAALTEGIRRIAQKEGIPIRLNRVGSMWTVYFTDRPVLDLASAGRSDIQRFKKFFHAALAEGVYWPPSAFESCFLSLAHSDAVIEQTLSKLQNVFRGL